MTLHIHPDKSLSTVLKEKGHIKTPAQHFHTRSKGYLKGFQEAVGSHLLYAFKNDQAPHL